MFHRWSVLDVLSTAARARADRHLARVFRRRRIFSGGWTIRTVCHGASILVLNAAAAASMAADVHPPVAEPLAAFDLVRENLQQLVTGHYVASGFYKRTPLGKSAQPASEFSEHLDCEFDFSTGDILFRRERTRLSGESTPLDFYPVAWIANRSGYAVAVHSGRTDDQGWNIAIRPRIDLQDPGFYFKPVIDIRTLPILSLEHADIPFEELSGLLGNPSLIVQQDESLSLVHHSDESASSQWWCDPGQGGQVVRYVKTPALTASDDRIDEILRSNPEFAQKIQRPSRIISESTTTWRRYNDIWAPVSHHQESRRIDVLETLSLKFEWLNVNEPIDHRHFDWRTWRLPEGSHIVDTRLGAGNDVTLARVGKSFETDLPNVPVMDTLQARRWLILANVAVAGFAAGWWLKRLRRRTSTNGGPRPVAQ